MLKIAGFEKLSLIDYPGKLSAIIFLYGCNLRCEYCHNPELVTIECDEKELLSEEKILKYLAQRVGKLDGVVITGGEPLIYDELGSLIKKIRKLGFLVKLDTNGLLPNRLKALIKKGLLDYISMDIKYSPDEYINIIGDGSFKKVQESISIIKSCGIDYEFRTTYVKGMHDLTKLEKLGELINGSKRYYIQNFRPGKTINSTLSSINSFTEKELKHIKRVLKPFVQSIEIR